MTDQHDWTEERDGIERSSARWQCRVCGDVYVADSPPTKDSRGFWSQWTGCSDYLLFKVHRS